MWQLIVHLLLHIRFNLRTVATALVVSTQIMDSAQLEYTYAVTRTCTYRDTPMRIHTHVVQEGIHVYLSTPRRL